MKLSPKARRLLDWIARAEPLLETQAFTTFGHAPIDELLRAGLVEIVAHPTVLERTEPPCPAAALVLRIPKETP